MNLKAKYSEIVICTTDTVVGIGGPINEEALSKIYELKKRPINKKIMILVGSIEQARTFWQWNEKADLMAQKLWPGANSIIINDQGFRMPNSPLLCEFLLQNGPLYMTSCNLSGEAPLSLEEAKKVFPDVSQFYDFGRPSGKPSTIYNLDTNKIIKR
ncbi:translation factor, SUA5 domain (plasmid) [Mycoplasmopsis gallopavonis]|uniref:L-threonylcarbamoyladenylate synthase n=1 Tax=Mycoplasmopsis gallopavonis TaxID=76629 RepID=A0A449B0D0_9BACT|nr:L-threonylcarbamoyladenylate synthase [Mycoplasmopsis gallopavonis]VEU73215.1 translation factor, SUA5 domain [Mycoplasmopsis gallopavonis]